MSGLLNDNDDAVLYVLKRFTCHGRRSKSLLNNEILMLLCLLELRGDVEQVWRVTPDGHRKLAESRAAQSLSADDAGLLATARRMASSMDQT